MEQTRAQPDRCPYDRPFSDSFSGCPAYIPRRWAVRALDDRELPSIWTCWHLAEGRGGAEGNSFYPRCTIGDAAARKHWTEAAGPEQVAAYRIFRQAVGSVDDGLLATALIAVQSANAASGASAVESRSLAVERVVAELRESAAAHAYLLAGSGLAVEDWVAVTGALS